MPFAYNRTANGNATSSETLTSSPGGAPREGDLMVRVSRPIDFFEEHSGVGGGGCNGSDAIEDAAMVRALRNIIVADHSSPVLATRGRDQLALVDLAVSPGASTLGSVALAERPDTSMWPWRRPSGAPSLPRTTRCLIILPELGTGTRSGRQVLPMSGEGHLTTRQISRARHPARCVARG